MILKSLLLFVVIYLASPPVQAQGVRSGVYHRYCPRYCRGSSCWCNAQGVCAESKFSSNYSPIEDDTHIINLNYEAGYCQALGWCDRKGVCKGMEEQGQSSSSEEEENPNDICKDPDYKCTILSPGGGRGNQVCDQFGRCLKTQTDLDRELDFCAECRIQSRGKCVREPSITRCISKRSSKNRRKEKKKKTTTTTTTTKKP